MKKTINIWAIGLLALGLASCGGKKDAEKAEIVLSPETTHIKGDLGDYFEVVDREYTVTNDWGDMVSVEVKRTDADYAFDITGVSPMGTHGQGVTANAGFGIEVLDENGNVIEKSAATAAGFGGMYSSDDMKEALSLKPGETATVRWSFHFNSDKKPAKFRLTSALQQNSTSSSSGSFDNDSSASDEDSDNSVSSAGTSGSEDWDSLLNSYEQYVDKYISYVKKAANGDMSALTEYPALMEKADEFSNKLSAAKGDMSSAQWARYMKITNKMATATQQM